jgi:dephospho-CoA kinase
MSEFDIPLPKSTLNDIIDSWEDHNVIEEGIHDKHLMKAILIAGAAGSGKSFIVEKMFTDMGCKFVNSDQAFELYLNLNNLPKKINMSDEEIYNKQMDVRDRAKKITTDRFHLWVDGMLPLVIDGTGRNFDKISSQNKMLEEFGYDTAMVFVNTSLEVSLKRNEKRERSVDPKLVEKFWLDVQKNIGAFQSLFGTDFFVVDNNEELDDRGIMELNKRLARIAMKFLRAPVRNHRGVEIMKAVKAINGEYISDLGSDLIQKVDFI